MRYIMTTAMNDEVILHIDAIDLTDAVRTALFRLEASEITIDFEDEMIAGRHCAVFQYQLDVFCITPEPFTSLKADTSLWTARADEDLELFRAETLGKLTAITKTIASPPFPPPSGDTSAVFPDEMPVATSHIDEQKNSPEHMWKRITESQIFAERAVVALWKRQTFAEQASEATHEKNGRGFNANDANILSSFAEWINTGRKLTPKQLEVARKRLRKYCKQLSRIANGEK